MTFQALGYTIYIMSDTNKRGGNNSPEEKQTFQKEKTFELDLQSMESKPVEREDAPTVKYSNIKRMLGTLDKFLSTKLSLVLGICTLAIASCSLGLFFSNAGSSSAASKGGNTSGGGGDITLNTWLWSILALFVFLAVLAIIHAIVRTRSKKKAETVKSN